MSKIYFLTLVGCNISLLLVGSVASPVRFKPTSVFRCGDIYCTRKHYPDDIVLVIYDTALLVHKSLDKCPLVILSIIKSLQNMLSGKDFIRKADELKQIIETRNAKHFYKLYRRVANDLINIAQRQSNIDFGRIFENYRSDYIFIFRNIFQDVRESGFGFDIRKQLKFKRSNIIEIKKQTADANMQELINDTFDIEYTKLLNNETEKLANNNFLQSEAQFFENLYSGAYKDYARYVKDLQDEKQKTEGKITELAFIAGLSAQQRNKEKILKEKNSAIERELQNINQNQNKEVLKKFKNKMEDAIETRSQGNAQYGTGRATSTIKELEYSTIATLSSIAMQKIWWERTQYFGGKPRRHHLALNGSQSDAFGNFQVGYYTVPTPRHESLPPSETVHCRCEAQYLVL
jgi:phage terminase small subunit